MVHGLIKTSRALTGASTLAISSLLLLGATIPALAQSGTPAARASAGEIGVLGDSKPVACDGANAPKPASAYAIDAENSIARYRSNEQLASQGANEAVGETRSIVGQILFDADGAPLPCSRFDVDLRTLQSDSSRRDNYLYGNTLETEKYPVATFILASVDGLDGGLPEGAETAMTLIGDLTFHGVTKQVAWEATVTKTGEDLTGEAKTTFDMSDFNITPPVVGPVLSIEPVVNLEISVGAAPAA